MESVDTQFNKWFDTKYPEGTLGKLPVMREAFKEVAYASYIEALCSTGIRFVSQRTSDDKIEFFFPKQS